MKKFILDLKTLSVEVHSNKEIIIDELFRQFLNKKIHKRHLKIYFFFGNKNQLICNNESDYFIFTQEKNGVDRFVQILLLVREVMSRKYDELGVFILHSCGLIFKGKTFVFIGKGGEGKTTIARNLLPEAQVISDDILMIHKVKHKFYASPFPLINNYNLITNIFSKIDKVYFIQKSDKTRQISMKKEDAISVLRQEVLPPNLDRERIINLLQDFVTRINIAKLEHYPFNESFKRYLN